VFWVVSLSTSIRVTWSWNSLLTSQTSSSGPENRSATYASPEAAASGAGCQFLSAGISRM
jgi:hypothetical protein